MKIGFYGGKFLPLHQGHVGCIIEAVGLCDILYIGVSYDRDSDKQKCESVGFPYVPHAKRVEWIEQITKDMPNVKVFAFHQSDVDREENWEHGANQILDFICDTQEDHRRYIDVIFGSEESYRAGYEKLYPLATYHLIDTDRKRYPISATQIRKDGAFAHWEMIPQVCRPFYNKKVAIVGTESCGKSTLVNKLATYYNTENVEEYGRTMCEFLGTGQPSAEYYEYIAYGHKTQEFLKMQTANKVLIVDTEATVTQFYNILYARNQSQVIDNISYYGDYDLVIYLEPDVPWVDDGLRKHGEDDERESLNSQLKELLRRNVVPFICIDGDYNQRFKKSVELIDNLL